MNTNEQDFLQISEDALTEDPAAADNDLSHLHPYFAGGSAEALDALSSLQGLLDALDMTEAELREMCEGDEENAGEE